MNSGGKQLQAINHLLKGKDVLFLAPTGLGKSAVYQVPAVLKKGTAIIISPLLALMDDQIFSLENKGIEALTINSTLGVRAKKQAFEKLSKGNVKLLYIAPETLLNPEIIKFINDNVDISFIAVDEAHIISQWGTSFRPKYLEISKVRQIFKPVPIIALTATADPITLEDIKNTLNFDQNSVLITHSIDRPNISYTVIQKNSEYKQVLNLIKKYDKDTCGIIYCMTRDKCETMEKFLTDSGIDCAFFHAGLPVKKKKEIQNNYLTKKLNLIIATVAFGMGIDRDDVRYVINVDIPNSLEEFSQMSGRASRDGKPADSYLLFSMQDYGKACWLLRQSVKNPERLAINQKKLVSILNYCETTFCRRMKILKYFGDPNIKQKCGDCDNCNK